MIERQRKTKEKYNRKLHKKINLKKIKQIPKLQVVNKEEMKSFSCGSNQIKRRTIFGIGA